ncbi:Peroxisome chaperone and import receptor [Dimargaris cristalligena]|uniref:Pex19 protein family-domain-containing protein n=1 Tax=Dimargaris cristalligena TaxID=215637 RepID=A0A4P9ZPH3_9FUNG|nr:Peroxisome chaperone and import receptor [Dimargaris cristalligena]RKP35334.1 Pex19 protein family-domain-containing protein [Dimargaris cristalligena]|eukprot:RKP35334.1 Pex19 protein family-domain-containing protein [Dimargaris cristalligena]
MSGPPPPKVSAEAAVADDDLDEFLDDILDDFNPPQTQPPAPPTSSAGPPSVTTTATTASTKRMPPPESKSVGHFSQDFEDEFARQLMEEMSQMMGQVDEAPALKSTMENLLQSLQGADLNDLMASPVASQSASDRSVPTDSTPTAAASIANPATSTSTTKGPASASKSQTFQERIVQTLNKLDTSSEQAQTDMSDDQNPDSLISEMMQQMEGLVDGDDFEKMMEGILEQIMTKDVLFEPMKELAERYPAWLESHRETLPAAEYEQYAKQYAYVKEIVAFYNAPDYEAQSQSEAGQGRIVALMKDMQDCGQPPKEILKDIAPDMDTGSDGMPKLPGMDNCSMM